MREGLAEMGAKRFDFAQKTQIERVDFQALAPRIEVALALEAAAGIVGKSRRDDDAGAVAQHLERALEADFDAPAREQSDAPAQVGALPALRPVQLRARGTKRMIERVQLPKRRAAMSASRGSFQLLRFVANRKRGRIEDALLRHDKSGGFALLAVAVALTSSGAQFGGAVALFVDFGDEGFGARKRINERRIIGPALQSGEGDFEVAGHKKEESRKESNLHRRFSKPVSFRWTTAFKGGANGHRTP